VKSIRILTGLALVFSLVIAPATYAQADDGQPVDETEAVPVMPADSTPAETIISDERTPTVAPTEIPATPTPIPTQTPAPILHIQATILKTDHVVCAIGKLPVATGGGCVAQLLPAPSGATNPPRCCGESLDWSAGPISQIPSPVGAPIFSSSHQPVSCCGESFIEFRLAPAALVTYGFPCAAGQCSGSAQDVWHATPTVHREEFLSAVLRAEQENQSWGPQHYTASVVAYDPGQEFQGRGYAVMTETERIIRFATTYAGPFKEHLDP